MRLLLGVTGGIAAYKACDLVSRSVKNGWERVTLLVDSGASDTVVPSKICNGAVPKFNGKGRAAYLVFYIYFCFRTPVYPNGIYKSANTSFFFYGQTHNLVSPCRETDRRWIPSTKCC